MEVTSPNSALNALLEIIMAEFEGVFQLTLQPRRTQDEGFVNLQVHLRAGAKYYIFSHTSRVLLTGKDVGKVRVEGMLFYSDILGQRGDGVHFTDIEPEAPFEVGLEQAKKWLSEQLAVAT